VLQVVYNRAASACDIDDQYLKFFTPKSSHNDRTFGLHISYVPAGPLVLIFGDSEIATYEDCCALLMELKSAEYAARDSWCILQHNREQCDVPAYIGAAKLRHSLAFVTSALLFYCSVW